MFVCFSYTNKILIFIFVCKFLIYLSVKRKKISITFWLILIYLLLFAIKCWRGPWVLTLSFCHIHQSEDSKCIEIYAVLKIHSLMGRDWSNHTICLVPSDLLCTFCLQFFFFHLVMFWLRCIFIHSVCQLFIVSTFLMANILALVKRGICSSQDVLNGWSILFQNAFAHPKAFWKLSDLYVTHETYIKKINN